MTAAKYVPNPLAYEIHYILFKYMQAVQAKGRFMWSWPAVERKSQEVAERLCCAPLTLTCRPGLSTEQMMPPGTLVATHRNTLVFK